MLSPLIPDLRIHPEHSSWPHTGLCQPFGYVPKHSTRQTHDRKGSVSGRELPKLFLGTSAGDEKRTIRHNEEQLIPLFDLAKLGPDEKRRAPNSPDAGRRGGLPNSAYVISGASDFIDTLGEGLP